MRKNHWRMGLMLLTALVVCEAAAPHAHAAGRKFGTITGTVRDNRGNPLAGALVTILREGASEVVRQTRSNDAGNFTTRVAPGRYLLRAIADGFSPATFSPIQIASSDELVYRFNLEPAGQGRTAPERRIDRNDPKFRLRASQSRRSVFNHTEDETQAAALEDAAETTADAETALLYPGGERASRVGRAHGVVETYFTSSEGSGSPGIGLNFAVANPVTDRLDVIFAGQLGELSRIEGTARVRAGLRHRVSATVGGMRIPTARASGFNGDTLGQFSIRAVDEWLVRDGIVVVFGLDYSRFLGAGGADSLSPRFGLQYDANARTRLKAAYAPGGDSERVQSVAMFEDGPVVFREQLQRPVALVDGQAVMERSHRLEFGVERLLDDSSTLEATAFFDTTDGRGVGLLSMSLNAFSNENGASLLNIANQQGAARGVRLVYTRRLGGYLTASAGYAFGRGQQLAAEGLTNPDQVFHSGYFQTAAAQLDADVMEGTRVRTVLRFSPSAAVFAIDPFAGKLAVYDPSLSILVTHELPNFGLPLRAQAVIDARNLLDVLNSVDDGETLMAVGATRRTVRGGISVRF